ncbi:NUDIX domain-containing protein [Allostreptomyces psammosilenae]|uniref:8-oxo-dGTP pyrophosphatase MutT (NUDIX family) n=1 Tax=Allostreptomyces psammosilenae TaxID=1892865 RepID=A0A852ZT54_9ACTN|nr:NUDIX hydrolase [Allostreptomyces psammosilenae]NYI04450.1 8-oxo-dGTP pyrophosphatase MutT (NUDIX family) [Allostreptomyces psammosilenae]
MTTERGTAAPHAGGTPTGATASGARPDLLEHDAWLATLPTFHAAAAALITDPLGRVLVVKPNYRPGWNLPGGVMEGDEPPHACCRREVAEEVGLDVTPGRLLVVDWVTPRPGARGWFGYVFDCGTLADPSAIRLQEEELDAYAFKPVEEAVELLPEYKAARLRAAVEAAARGTTAYLHGGTPVAASS